MKNFNEVINDVFLSKNGIVLTDKEKMFLLIVYNDASIPCLVMYNKNLIYYCINPIRQANEILEQFDNNGYDNFDENKIEEYKKSNNLIIINQRDILYYHLEPMFKIPLRI